ncbi:MAG: hypothetical protein KAI73_11925 [Rhodospirillaceae bacterium]|nr:hypothetical protein [Rhodospirillaceae bacterium]
MSNPSAADIQNQMEKAKSLINTAQRLLADGQMIDLSALEERVAELSQSLKSTGVETAQPFIAPVGKLIDSLDQLEKDLTAHQQNLQHEQQRLDRQKARNAYQSDKE